MKPKTTIYLLLLGGCVLLIGIWAWVLADGVKLLEVIVGCMATAILCFGSSSLATRRLKGERFVELGDIASGTAMGGVAIGIIGAFVLLFEHVPSKTGHGSHLDRRYALLFFAVAVYLVLFPVLSGRKSRP